MNNGEDLNDARISREKKTAREWQRKASEPENSTSKESSKAA